VCDFASRQRAPEELLHCRCRSKPQEVFITGPCGEAGGKTLEARLGGRLAGAAACPGPAWQRLLQRQRPKQAGVTGNVCQPYPRESGAVAGAGCWCRDGDSRCRWLQQAPPLPSGTAAVVGAVAEELEVMADGGPAGPDFIFVDEGLDGFVPGNDPRRVAYHWWKELPEHPEAQAMKMKCMTVRMRGWPELMQKQLQHCLICVTWGKAGHDGSECQLAEHQHSSGVHTPRLVAGFDAVGCW